MPDWLSNTLQYVFDFSNVLNASISASWLVLVVIALRVVLKKAPKWTHVALWGIVALRIMMPFSIESVFSLIPSTQTVSDQVLQAGPVPGAQPAYLEIVTNPSFGRAVTVELSQTISSFQWDLLFMVFVWMAGMVLMTGYTLISYWRLQRKVNTATILRENIFQSEYVGSPFVLGIIKPRIYLPYTMNGQDMEHVIAHEQAHIHRRDHWWKPLGFLLLTIHWFNPLMWLAYALFCRDIELACDEKVIKELDNEQRADYTQALVVCSVNRRMIAACPLAFGEVGVKERVKSVMKYKKPAFWIVVLAIIACAVLAVCFLTNPITMGDHFVLTNTDSPANTNKLSYDIQLGNKAMSGQIYVEQWSDGVCVKSAPVVMTQYVDSIEITMKDRRESGTSIGTDVQIETNQYGGSLLTYFAHPENLNVVGWGFKGYELGDRNELTPDKDVILAAKVFDCGNGVRTFNSETLIAEPERIENAEYMIVVRAQFSTEPVTTTNQSEIVERLIGYSALYSEELINEAFNVAEREFYQRFDHCTLTALRYDEEIENRYADIQMNWWNNNGQELITVYSTFETSKASSGACVWYLVRTKDNKSWEYATWEHLGKSISLNDVIMLSQKGYELTWADFEQFKYIETGSGLYIRVYEINEMYELWIGGSWINEDPMYIYLALADDLDTRIDIRDGGVTEFLSEHHMDVVQEDAVKEALSESAVRKQKYAATVVEIGPNGVIVESQDEFGITVPNEWVERDAEMLKPAPEDSDPDFSMHADGQNDVPMIVIPKE